MILAIYWILFWVGLGFAVVSAVFAGFGEAMGGHTSDFSMDHDVDLGGGTDTVGFGDAQGDANLGSGDFYHGGGEIALSPVSPITIAAFVGGFGGGGLIGHYMGLVSWATLIIALPVGLVLAFSVYYLMYLLNKSNVSSEGRVTEVIGLTAEVITPIVEDKTGEICYTSRGSRYTSPARSIRGESIARGRPVKIMHLVGSSCYVKEINPELVEDPPMDPIDGNAPRK